MSLVMAGTDFAAAAPEDVIQKTAEALRKNNFEAVVVDDGDAARRKVLELVPEGSQVHSGKSKTLEDIGLFKELHESGKFDSVRARSLKMDRATQGNEIRRLSAAPDFMLGSAHAVTEAGQLVSASYSASQLGPLASGAGRVILVVGSQKIVPDLDVAMRRIQEHVFPYEDERLMAAMGVHTRIAKVLINNLDPVPGRTTVILVRQPVGA
jgi:hypothetical protein